MNKPRSNHMINNKGKPKRTTGGIEDYTRGVFKVKDLIKEESESYVDAQLYTRIICPLIAKNIDKITEEDQLLINYDRRL
jgi:hypothetical protein